MVCPYHSSCYLVGQEPDIVCHEYFEYCRQKLFFDAVGRHLLQPPEELCELHNGDSRLVTILNQKGTGLFAGWDEGEI